MNNLLASIIKPRAVRSGYCGTSFPDVDTEGMPGKKDEITFEGREPSTLFREFAAECIALSQTNPSPEKRALYLKMASVWHQMAQRWEGKN
jgi:hypothetical protein